MPPGFSNAGSAESGSTTQKSRSLSGLSPPSHGTEQIDFFGLIEFRHPADQLSNCLVSAHSDVIMLSFVDSNVDELLNIGREGRIERRG